MSGFAFIFGFKSESPYEKISCDFCPKNIQLNLLRFLYDLPYNKRCNKSHGNHTKIISDF